MAVAPHGALQEYVHLPETNLSGIDVVVDEAHLLFGETVTCPAEFMLIRLLATARKVICLSATMGSAYGLNRHARTLERYASVPREHVFLLNPGVGRFRPDRVKLDTLDYNAVRTRRQVEREAVPSAWVAAVVSAAATAWRTEGLPAVVVAETTALATSFHAHLKKNLKKYGTELKLLLFTGKVDGGLSSLFPKIMAGATADVNMIIGAYADCLGANFWPQCYAIALEIPKTR